jgi:hypothetical protein
MDSFCESMDSYRIVTTNPDFKKIRFVSWITNPDLKDLFPIISHESSQFSKIRPFLRIQWILTNPKYYGTKRILKNRDSQIRILTNPEVSDLRIQTLKIRIMDSFCENKNLKLLDSFRFVKICIPIPHP